MVNKIFKHEFYSDYCNYLQFNLLTPDFVIWKQERNEWLDKSRSTRISFPSKFIFSIDSDAWILEVQLLGFGFGIIRQWTY